MHNVSFNYRKNKSRILKVIVTDSDVATRGTACYSINDPHMKTFDEQYVC